MLMNTGAYLLHKLSNLEDLIIDYSFDKSTRPVWNKIKRYFYNDELPSEMIRVN